MYRDMPMNQRIERIGELLAKGVYLCVKKEREKKSEQQGKRKKGEDSKQISEV